MYQISLNKSITYLDWETACVGLRQERNVGSASSRARIWLSNHKKVYAGARRFDDGCFREDWKWVL